MNMEINRPVVKAKARKIITNTRPNPLMIGLVLIAVDLLLSYLLAQLMGLDKISLSDARFSIPGGIGFSVPIPITDIAPAAWVLIFAILLMSSVLSTGFCSYCLKICQGEKADYKNLLDGFTIFLKLILLKLLIWLLVFFQFLMFIVPGIIASYSYRQAEYILLENPELRPLECIRRSEDMMRGHRFDLFLLDLSFIGWALLSSVLMFPAVWYVPYSGVCYAYYYTVLRDMPELIAKYNELTSK